MQTTACPDCNARVTVRTTCSINFLSGKCSCGKIVTMKLSYREMVDEHLDQKNKIGHNILAGEVLGKEDNEHKI